jgi:hypothetical protein
MSCDIAKFTITKNLDNTFVFTIKADGSTLPMEITEGTDTFSALLISLETGVTALTKSLTVENALSGQVALVITAAETTALVEEKGSKTDRYYLRPVYRLVIDCTTVNNGAFLAKVPEVYVD